MEKIALRDEACLRFVARRNFRKAHAFRALPLFDLQNAGPQEIAAQHT
jgi:hypothetical protein